MQPYRAALKEARDSFTQKRHKLAEIEAEAYELKNEIVRLRRTITALSAMCSEDPFFDSLGITEAVREVMTTSKVSMKTEDVVHRLELIGFDLASQKNVAASVNSVLSRLARRQEIVKIEDELSPIIWRGPNYDQKEDEENIPF